MLLIIRVDALSDEVFIILIFAVHELWRLLTKLSFDLRISPINFTWILWVIDCSFREHLQLIINTIIHHVALDLIFESIFRLVHTGVFQIGAFPDIILLKLELFLDHTSHLLLLGLFNHYPLNFSIFILLVVTNFTSSH